MNKRKGERGKGGKGGKEKEKRDEDKRKKNEEGGKKGKKNKFQFEMNFIKCCQPKGLNLFLISLFYLNQII